MSIYADFDDTYEGMANYDVPASTKSSTEQYEESILKVNYLFGNVHFPSSNLKRDVRRTFDKQANFVGDVLHFLLHPATLDSPSVSDLPPEYGGPDYGPEYKQQNRKN